jgi:hypothetical protein
MANLIQASVYQIDGAPLPSAITLDFQTSNLVIREASIVGTSAVNSAILYYNLPNNQLSVQTFYVGESIAELVAAANVGSTTQLQATVLEINKDPQVPGGVQYSFPANEIVIGENIDYALPDVKSYIQFKGIRYSVFEVQADLLVSGNGASAYKVYTALLTQSGGSNGVNQTSGTFTVGVTYGIDAYNAGDDFSNIGGPAAGLQGQWDGFSFVATGTTALVYSNSSSIDHNEGAPVVTVLENTIGNIFWTYAITGSYVGYLPDTLLTEGKQIILSIPYSFNNGTVAYYMAMGNNDVDGEVGISTSDGTSLADVGFNNFPIEIRVYN